MWKSILVFCSNSKHNFSEVSPRSTHIFSRSVPDQGIILFYLIFGNYYFYLFGTIQGFIYLFFFILETSSFCPRALFIHLVAWHPFSFSSKEIFFSERDFWDSLLVFFYPSLVHPGLHDINFFIYFETCYFSPPCPIHPLSGLISPFLFFRRKE